MKWPDDYIPEGFTPFYIEPAGIIFNCDCRDILPHLPRVDLVLTDPPYGIAEKWKGGFNKKHGWGKALIESDLRNQWDVSVPDSELMVQILAKGNIQIIWGGNYFDLPISRCWLVWNKPERNFSLAEAELAWTNADNVVRVCDCNRSDVERKHPTQKPIKLFSWCLSLPWAKESNIILDPFLGSGTTALAAKELGRKFIGVEISLDYCKIAVKRLRQGVLGFTP
jgi:DNA modification methylase